MAALGSRMPAAFVCLCVYIMHTHIVTRTDMQGVCVCVCVRRGVVRQLTSCANDHLAAESHNVLQHFTAFVVTVI